MYSLFSAKRLRRAYRVSRPERSAAFSRRGARRDALAAVEAQREREGVCEVFGRRGHEVIGRVGHAGER